MNSQSTFNPVFTTPPKQAFGLNFKPFLANAFSFETSFVLFLFSGQLKADPFLASFRFDLTLLLFALSFVTGSYLVVRQKSLPSKNGIAVFALCFLFFSWYGFGLVWSSSLEYGTQKTLYLLVLNSWAAAGSALVVSTQHQRWLRFINLLLLLSLVFALRSLFTPANESGFVQVFGSNYLGLGRLAGLGAIITFCMAKNFASHQQWSKRLAMLVLVAVFFYSMLISGGRGPLLAASATLLVGIVSVLRNLKFSTQVFVIGSVCAVLVYVLFFTSSNLGQSAIGDFRTLQRLELALSGQNSLSAGARENFFSDSVQLWLAYPYVGTGIGSWAVREGLGDVRAYPHNIFTEVGVEAGLIGIFLLLLPVVAGVWFWLQSRHPEKLLWMLLFLLVLLNAQLSGDINDNRFLFSVICLSPVLLLKKRAV